MEMMMTEVTGESAPFSSAHDHRHQPNSPVSREGSPRALLPMDLVGSRVLGAFWYRFPHQGSSLLERRGFQIV
jgi:hypothetical protein